ncbi:reverse transcriptase domain-containing protein [Tanacetum coccineum]
MTRTIVKRLTKPLDEPEREFQRLRRSTWHLQQNESQAIAERNLFDDEASSSNNTGTKPPTPLKTLHEHSYPNSSGLRSEDPLRYIQHYLSIIDNIQADRATRDTSRLCFFHFSLKGKAAAWFDKIPSTQNMTWDQLVSRFLDYFFPAGCTSSLRDMILQFKKGTVESIKSAWICFQNLIKQAPHYGIQKWLLVQIFHDNISPNHHMKLDQFAQFRFNSLTEEEGWNRIEEYVQYQDDMWDDLLPSMNVSFISEAMQPTFRGRLKRACNQISYLETPTQENNPAEKVYLSGGDIYDDPSLLRFYQNDDTPPWGNIKRKDKGEDGPEWVVKHREEMHEQFSQIFSTTRKIKTPKSEAPTFAITTRSGVSTRDPPFRPFQNRHLPTTLKGKPKRKDSRAQNQALHIMKSLPPGHPFFYQPSKSSNLPFPSRVKKQKKDDEDERLLSIFKQIRINFPFLESMIHMPKGAKVLKDLLSHKEKLEKAASSVKLSEECSAIIQRSLPYKEGDPRSFTLPCLIRPLAVKNALADLGAILEMDEDELVLIILGWPFLATVRVVIDVHERKLSLRVGSETVTFNIGKSIKSKHSRDDYLYCADYTAKLVQEQWVDTVDHDRKWTEV